MMKNSLHIDTADSRVRPAWLHSLADEPTFAVMFTGRGDSSRPFASKYSDFNLCHYTGDDPAHVSDCRARLAAAIGVAADDIVVPRQTHSAEVLTVGDAFPAAGELEGVDGLVTTVRCRVIGVSTADCLPVLAVDPVAAVAGAFHAGWRGALGGILEKGIAAMTAEGATPGNIRVWIGPAICVDCFEVGEEVAALFPSECVKRSAFWPRPHVDLAAYSVLSLRCAGVSDENIIRVPTKLCTRCHPDRYFSARAEGINSGRNFSFVFLK